MTVKEQIGVLLGLQATLIVVAMVIVWIWRSGPAERALRFLSRP